MNDPRESAESEVADDEYQVDTVVDRIAERIKLAREKRVVTTRDAVSIVKDRALRKLEDASRDLLEKSG